MTDEKDINNKTKTLGELKAIKTSPYQFKDISTYNNDNSIGYLLVSATILATTIPSIAKLTSFIYKMGTFGKIAVFYGVYKAYTELISPFLEASSNWYYQNALSGGFKKEQLKSLRKALLSPFSSVQRMMEEQTEYSIKQDELSLMPTQLNSRLIEMAGGSILYSQEKNYELVKKFLKYYNKTTQQISPVQEKALFNNDKYLKEYYLSDPDMYLKGSIVKNDIKPTILPKQKEEARIINLTQFIKARII